MISFLELIYFFLIIKSRYIYNVNVELIVPTSNVAIAYIREPLSQKREYMTEVSDDQMTSLVAAICQDLKIEIDDRFQSPIFIGD